MRIDMMEILVCPDCKQELTLQIESEEDGDIITGTLTCAACGNAYPIENSIPNMLPPELRGQD